MSGAVGSDRRDRDRDRVKSCQIVSKVAHAVFRTFFIFNFVSISISPIIFHFFFQTPKNVATFATFATLMEFSLKFLFSLCYIICYICYMYEFQSTNSDLIIS